MIRIALLASGRGSNVKALLESIKNGVCNAKAEILITNKSDAGAISVAREYSVPVEIVERKDFASREEMDKRIKEILDSYNVELVVLAGYMVVLKGKELLESYKGKIINIHPSLLPSFPGVDAQRQAFDYGCKVSGVTIHLVDASLDGGPILYQEAVDISDCKDEYEAADKILEIEHKSYAMIVDSFSKGKYVIEGRKAVYFRN